MASPVRTLLKKKKLTGEELGRILLIYIAGVQKGETLLTDEELNSLVKYIDNPRDGKIYNAYLDIERYVIAMSLDFEAENRKLNVIYLELFRHWQRAMDAEKTYYGLMQQPRIMTRRDYEQALAEARELLKKETYSFFYLILHETIWQTATLDSGFNSYLEPILESLKQQAISEEMLRDYQRIYDDEDNTLEGVTKYDYLKEYIYVYDPEDADDPEAPLGLLRDYPEVVEAILAKYSQLKGLKHLGKMKKADYIRDDLISFKTAFNLDILKAKENYEEPILEFKGMTLANGVAVLDNIPSNARNNHIKERTYTSKNVKDGTYYYDFSFMGEAYLAENLLADEEKTQHIRSALSSLKRTLKRINAFNYALDKIIEITGVKELEVFRAGGVNETVFEITIEHAEGFKYFIRRVGLLENERPAKELQEEMLKLFSPDFTLDDVAIKPEEKAKVQEIIDDSSAKNDAVREMSNYLTGLKA